MSGIIKRSAAKSPAVQELQHEQTARRCAEIVMETRLLDRSERRFHADPDDIPGLLNCAYQESAYRILSEFQVSAIQKKPPTVSLLSDLTYAQMGDLVRLVSDEVKRRNSIGVNIYVYALEAAAGALYEISGGEQGNFTSEVGPREPKTKRKLPTMLKLS